MSFESGDRVRWKSTGDDGLPLVRYGFVGTGGFDGYAQVMLDGDLKSNSLAAIDQLDLVTITTVELEVQGCDLLDDPAMCQGLVHLWSAEADQAGLEVDQVTFLSARITLSAGVHVPTVALAEIQSGGQQYLLQARSEVTQDTIHVRATLPHH